MFLTCVDIKNPRPLFLWWTLVHNESVFEHWFTYTTPLNLTHFKGIIKAFSGMYVRLTSITFPVMWSSVLISGLVFKCFRINNIELKCSFVRCRKDHQSWWNGAAKLHISVDLLCGATSTEPHNSVDFLGGTAAAKLHNSVDLLCGTTDTALNSLVWWMHQESPKFSNDSDEPCWRIWRLNPK